jgi:hypothetical protein
MKYKVGDLVARICFTSEEIKLGYISRLTKIDGHGYYVYFFDLDKEVWYSEDYVDAFKQVLEKWENK